MTLQPGKKPGRQSKFQTRFLRSRRRSLARRELLKAVALTGSGDSSEGPRKGNNSSLAGNTGS